ncbi:hypothetical protein J4464_06125 [Candidatus Woesearchaeota archaeon]|nr:hypothetical protein [Candidatus Woesearchaeota archaeon]
MKKNKRGEIWISAVLYVLIAALAMVLILQAGMPLLTKMKDNTAYSRSKDTMIGLDRQIRDVATEGQGSQRVIPLEVRQGDFIIDDSRIRWELETESKIIEPRTKVSLGNVNVYSNADVETRVDNNKITLSNSRIKAVFNNAKSPPEVNINGILTELYYIDENGIENSIDTSDFAFNLACNPGANAGLGYTELLPPGNNSRLGSAKLIFHMVNGNQPCAESYDVEFILESEADFIKTRIVNVVSK